MFAHYDTVLTDDDAASIGSDFHRPPDRRRQHRVFVVVEPYRAGLGYRSENRMEAVEGTAIGNELVALLLEHLPDRTFGLFDVAMGFGVGDAFVQQPGVHLIIGPEP